MLPLVTAVEIGRFNLSSDIQDIYTAEGVGLKLVNSSFQLNRGFYPLQGAKQFIATGIIAYILDNFGLHIIDVSNSDNLQSLRVKQQFSVNFINHHSAVK